MEQPSVLQLEGAMRVDELIAEQAAEWIVRLETAGSTDLEAFRHWLAESPLHVREMLAASTTQIVLAHLFRARKVQLVDLEHSNVPTMDD